MPYVTPLQDFRFALNELAGLDEVLKLPGFEEVTPDLVDAILEENGRFVEQAVAPLNVPGDTQPPVWKDGHVTTTPGYAQGFKDYAAGGWQGLQHPVAWGGQGLPKLVAAAPGENIQAASLAFSLCPMLTDGVIEALLTVGSEAQRKQYVPQLIGGKWTGTMNLTEPQAGSDLAQVATRAVKQADGSYRLSGQKIFITYGDHDLAENIIHLVLARTPDAPAGVKGISLFIVPKFLVQPDGSLGKRNDVWCASLEHKLGIHGSPTAVLLYGSGKGEVGDGAIGYLVGEQNRGLEYMFIMMNAARFSVGQQGIGVSERACQHALAYARDRVQGRAVEGSAAPVAIVRHPDVQRMLMTMKALTEAARAVSYVTAAAHDKGTHHPDPEQRSRNRAFYEYMVPIVKGYSTETAVEVASLGLQVHGGMGYIEETGAAQYYRDARILPIYEGTTAIQANDLVSRKTQRDGGATAHAAIAAMRETLRAVETEAKRASAGEQEGLRLLRDNLDSAIQAYEAGVAFILEQSPVNIRAVYSSSVPYLMLAGVVHGGWQMARAVLACRRHLAAGSTDPFHTGKLATGLFYGAHILPRALALSAAVRAGVVADACGAGLNIA
ncbi:acyl-CoA dehydrogenase [Achromobacter sp.]|uniref:acyl-CoA dehydrogenase n=1 Tax=Achromobacter sp. TaxID=134375 RepID=UPI002F94E4DF